MKSAFVDNALCASTGILISVNKECITVGWRKQSRFLGIMEGGRLFHGIGTHIYGKNTPRSIFGLG